jgi:hypothetical protein
MADLIAGLILTFIVACAGVTMLWNQHQINATIRMCKRGDHSMCTSLSPWCPQRN